MMLFDIIHTENFYFNNTRYQAPTLHSLQTLINSSYAMSVISSRFSKISRSDLYKNCLTSTRAC